MCIRPTYPREFDLTVLYAASLYLFRVSFLPCEPQHARRVARYLFFFLLRLSSLTSVPLSSSPCPPIPARNSASVHDRVRVLDDTSCIRFRPTFKWLLNVGDFRDAYIGVLIFSKLRTEWLNISSKFNCLMFDVIIIPSLYIKLLLAGTDRIHTCAFMTYTYCSRRCSRPHYATAIKSKSTLIL